MGPIDRAAASLPVAGRTSAHLEEVLGRLSDAELADRINGYRQMLDQLPADDDTMRPTIEVLRDVLAVELAVRERERR